MTYISRTLFDEIVLDDPGVCNNCYRHTHDVISHWYPSHYIDTTGQAMFINPRRYRRLDATDVVYPTDDDSGPQTACECGVLDGQAFERPLSMDKTIDYTHNIVDRLDAVDLDYDESALYDEVRRLKSDPDVFKSDEAIFRAAVKHASAINVREFASRPAIATE